MTLSKKYKFIEILDSGNEYAGRPVYEIIDNHDQWRLGEIYYYASWKQYVFEADHGAVYNESCLRNILDFMVLIKETDNAKS